MYVPSDWPVKRAIVNLPISTKGNLKRTSGNLLSLLGAKKMHRSTALPMLLSHYYPILYLRHRLYPTPNKRNLTVESGLTFSNCTGCGGITWHFLPSPLPSGEISLEIPTVLQVKEWIIVLETVFGNGEQQFCGEGPRILLWEDKGALQSLKITLKTQNSRETYGKRLKD